jgi:hypothetical protein
MELMKNNERMKSNLQKRNILVSLDILGEVGGTSVKKKRKKKRFYFSIKGEEQRT